MTIQMDWPLANNHPDGPASCKCLSGWTGLLQIIIQRDQHLPNDHPDQPDSSKKHHPLPQNISSWSSNLKDQGSISIKKTRTLCSRKNTKCSCSLIPQGSISCAVLGYAGYYTSMAMFAWMTVRSFWKFSYNFCDVSKNKSASKFLSFYPDFAYFDRGWDKFYAEQVFGEPLKKIG